MVFSAAKWCAKENGSPSRPASWALKPLEPSSHTGGWLPSATTALTPRASEWVK